MKSSSRNIALVLSAVIVPSTFNDIFDATIGNGRDSSNVE